MQKFILPFIILWAFSARANQLSNFSLISANPLTFTFTHTIDGKSHDFKYSKTNGMRFLENVNHFSSTEEELLFLRNSPTFNKIEKKFAQFKEDKRLEQLYRECLHRERTQN